MDAGIWVDTGLAWKLQVLTGQVVPSSLWVILGVNAPFLPLPGWTVPDIVQPAFGGYMPVAVSSWGVPFVGAGALWTVTGSVVVFSNTTGSPETVQGWGLASGPGPTDTLLMAGAFALPPVLLAGGVLVESPSLTDKSA